MKIENTYCSDRLDDLVSKLEALIENRRLIEEQKKLEVLKEKKIVGMTITGASINSSLIQKLGPEIVLVEEAGEILEPCLVSAISRSTKHLILIGDHKQLRPNVDTFNLKLNCNFDISMMERLIRFILFYLLYSGILTPEIFLKAFLLLIDNVFMYC